jgi:hypothetical protein
MDKEWEDTQVWSDKVDRVRRTRSGVSPPPRGMVSESTDSRRKGGNAGRYVSSPGPEDKAVSPDKEEPQDSLSNVRYEDRLAKEGSSSVEEGEKALLVSEIKEQALLATESGEHALLEAENGEQALNSTNARRGATRPLRESRKSPFFSSPTRLHESDDGFDAILESQRQEDERMGEDQEAYPQRKRKVMVLSDDDFRHRKERTENLFEGYRNIREQRASGLDRSHLIKKAQEGIGEKEEQIDSKEKGRKQGCKDDPEPVPVPDSSDPPPPPFPDEGGSDSDSEDESGVGTVGQTLAALQVEEDFPEIRKGKTTRIVMTVRQIRRVMAARESLFKFGVFVPRSEREAEASPEAPRWKAGKDLEWLRLRERIGPGKRSSANTESIRNRT